MNLENLLNSNTGQQLVKTYHAEQQQKRTDLFIEMDEIKERRNSELQTLNLALDKAQTNFNAAQTKLTEAETCKHTAAGDVHRTTASYKAQIERVSRQILKTAPEVINDFIIEIKQDMDDLRNTGFTQTNKLSNIKSFNARLQAMREAVIEAQALKLQAVPDIGSMLQALRAGLPAITMQ